MLSTQGLATARASQLGSFFEVRNSQGSLLEVNIAHLKLDGFRDTDTGACQKANERLVPGVTRCSDKFLNVPEIKGYIDTRSCGYLGHLIDSSRTERVDIGRWYVLLSARCISNFRVGEKGIG